MINIDPSFKPENYKKYNPKGIKVIEHEITSKGGGISASKMREFIMNDQKDLFQNNLPDNVNKDKIWNIVIGLNEDFYDEINTLGPVKNDNLTENSTNVESEYKIITAADKEIAAIMFLVSIIY